MKNQEKEEISRIFFHTLHKLIQSKSKLDQRIFDYQFDVFQSVIIDLTGTDKLLFNTLFARIAYLGIQYKLPGSFQYELHLYRKEAQNRQQFESYVDVYQLGLYVIGRLLIDLYGVQAEDNIKKAIYKPEYDKVEPELLDYHHSVRGFIYSFNAKEQEFEFVSEENPDKRVKLALSELDLFQGSIRILKEWDSQGYLPVNIELLEVGVGKDAKLYPKWIVIDPDYLIDVTAIAECFSATGARPEYYLLNKFLPTEPSKYLIIGHIVNYILDELIHDSSLEFKHLLNRIFKLAPLGLTLLPQKDLHDLIKDVRKHYDNLVRVVQSEFPGLDLHVKGCTIEPSFYAPELGIQGRLDVWHQNEKKQFSIIELKSGKPFRENMYGLNSNHYTQTLLYDLMIRSVYSLKNKPLNYILYSKLENRNLRFAPTIKAAQMEAIDMRNEIYGLERALTRVNKEEKIFQKMRISNFPNISGFLRRDIEHFEEVFSGLDKIEHSYIREMIAFIALEHHLAKTGLHGNREHNGLSSLWLEEVEKKIARFSIFVKLRIKENKSMMDPPLIRLRKTKESNKLASFRVGDIVVLRPWTDKKIKKMENQVIRASLIEIADDDLLIKLRSKQYNQSYLKQFDLWQLEPDFLDSGFRKMYESLFIFAEMAEEKRQLLLGRRAASKPDVLNIRTKSDKLTNRQSEIVGKMLQSKDYFLLWGPPGTGKTSVMLAEAVEWLLDNTEQQILLLAYTNRAVDEMCEMLHNLGSKYMDYIRIGSKYATGTNYRQYLLDYHMESLNTREALKRKFDETRVFTATISSIAGKQELFKLKQFDIVFIDEASQILEPMVIGLLDKFKKFVLIGDHKQLPAVVVQDEEKQVPMEASLQEIGFSSSSTAFFERLYKQCVRNEWHWSIGQLFEQGRMHKDIQIFPNKYFYSGKLKCLQGKESLNKPLKDRYNSDYQNNDLAESRMLFIHCEGEDNMELAKNNSKEAELIISILRELRLMHEKSGLNFNEHTVGVITPFRAQIAQIRKTIDEQGLDLNQISVDTVERYQGGARDIIVFSTVVNSISRLDQMVALDSEGTDRKLNVVITRAKEQFILVGNKTILNQNELYRHLIENCREISL